MRHPLPDYSYRRYLESKQSVDDRALHRGVLRSLQDALKARSRESLRVLEVGGAAGSMVRRVIEWGLIGDADYVLVDSDAQALAHLPQALESWATSEESRSLTPGDAKSLQIRHGEAALKLSWEHSDIGTFLSSNPPPFDLVIAHAVLDLIDLESFLPRLWKRCRRGAHYWFTINFDGESVFLPPLPHDQAIWDAYHQSMNRRPGSSHAGRKLFAQLGASGARIDAAGSSDWIVHAKSIGYPGDEAYFLHHIVHTITNELGARPPVNPNAFASWVAQRHEQIDRSELIYIAHQLDFTGCAP